MLARFAVGSLTYLICCLLALGGVEPNAADNPISTVGMVRGACPEGQLSTERGCVRPPRLERKFEPEYPTSALPRRDGATVVLGAVVEKDGVIGKVTVLESTRPGLGYEESAVRAVKKWRYEPARIGDNPVRVYFGVTVRFWVK